MKKSNVSDVMSPSAKEKYRTSYVYAIWLEQVMTGQIKLHIGISQITSIRLGLNIMITLRLIPEKYYKQGSDFPSLGCTSAELVRACISILNEADAVNTLR